MFDSMANMRYLLLYKSMTMEDCFVQIILFYFIETFDLYLLVYVTNIPSSFYIKNMFLHFLHKWLTMSHGRMPSYFLNLNSQHYIQVGGKSANRRH